MVDEMEMIDGGPTKGFFIDILTRDVSIVAAILDLVDNSVDSARQLRPDGNLNGVAVRIVANEIEFSIDDNCAGITIQHARDYVFKMGRPKTVAPSPGSIGQFGVGMKRSLFKLGSSFVVESTSGSGSFTVEVDPRTWNDNETDWKLPMTVHEVPNTQTGTTILVDVLHPQVKESFASKSFQASLADELRSRHRLAMGNGLEISLNGDELVATDSAVATSDLLKPAARSFAITTSEFGDLVVKIVVGVAPTGATGVDEDAEPEEQSRAARDAGWLVFGNGRLLLANDKTHLTGWGSGRKKIPQYHNQYARFRGFVYMEANNAGAIPWNTMKTSVDPDSPIWRQVLDQMIETARSIIDLLNQAKVERQLATDEMETPTLDAIRDAKSIDAISVLEVEFSMSIDDLTSGVAIKAVYPEANPELAESWKRIQYAVLAQAFDELASAVGETRAAEIGRLSFDAYHAANVES